MSMEQSIMDLLINGSPMAAFAGFLAWNLFQNRKQIQEMNDKQFELFRELQSEKEVQVEKLRTRYDVVIERLELRDKDLRNSIESRLDALEKGLGIIANQISGLADRLQKLEIKEIVKSSKIENT